MPRFIVVFCLLFTCNLLGQTPGQINPDFYSGITGYGIGDGSQLKILKTLQLSNGKLLISNPSMYNRNDIAALARLNADGTLDTTFKTDQTALLPVVDIVNQSDGKLIVGSNFYTNPLSITLLNRLLENGEIDNSFHCNVYGTSSLNSVDIVRLQQDGKIIINGLFTEINGVEMDYNSICRILTTGELDTTFHFSSPLPNSAVHEIVIRPDGKILVSLTGFDGVFDYVSQVLLLNEDGTIDSSFNVGSAVANSITDLKLQSDGKILVGGKFNSYNGSEANKLLRLFNDGTIDTSFFVEPSEINNVLSLDVYADGRILVGTDWNTPSLPNNKAVVRLFDNGAVDGSFQLESQGYFEVYSMAITTDEKVVVSGNLDELNGGHFGRIARLFPTGELDETFNPKNGVNDHTDPGVLTSIVQPDGKIVIGGHFNTVQGENRLNIARLLPNGMIDTSFEVSVYISLVRALALTPEGKILIGGESTNPNLSGILCLNTDGTIDPTFMQNLAINYVNDIQVQADGKILVAGHFGNEKVFRLNSNGSIDGSFISGFSADYTVYTICTLSNGKMMVGGEFTSFGGSQYQSIARLTNLGGVDATFTPVVFASQPSATVNKIKQLLNGDLIIGGHFELINGQRNLARISVGGTVDATFDPVVESDASINDFTFQDNGELIVVGDFSTIDGYESLDIAALSPSGNYLPAFNCQASSTYTSTVFTIQEMVNGALFIGGSFTDVNDIGKNRMASVFGFDPYLAVEMPMETASVLFPNPAKTILKLQTENSQEVLFIKAVNSLGQVFVIEWSVVDNEIRMDIDSLQKGWYSLLVQTADEFVKYPFIIE